MHSIVTEVNRQIKVHRNYIIMNKEQSKFFKRHYKADFHNLGPLVTEMEVIRRIEGW